MQDGVTKRVEEFYRNLIRDSRPGDKLPSERTMTQELDTCRSTIRIVLTKLVAEGLVRPEHGKGYFIV